MPRGNEPLGNIATEVLFENDRVKIWSLVVDPGQASPWHLHPRDYITITAEGDRINLELEDGTIEPSVHEPGRWRFHTDHVVHRVVNNSNTRYRNVLIELKS